MKSKIIDLYKFIEQGKTRSAMNDYLTKTYGCGFTTARLYIDILVLFNVIIKNKEGLFIPGVKGNV